MKIHSQQHPHRLGYRHPRGPRGVILITTMWIAIALSAVVLVLCREMQVEQLTARQHLAQAQADAAEIGVEQYVMSVVEQELLSPGYKDQIKWEQKQMGSCYFWVLTPNLDDERQPAYGLTDEASKLDINYATEDMLEQLANLDMNIAAAMYDWHTPGESVTVNQNSGAQGAKSDFYEANYGYHSKNANYETLDELRLVSGLTASDEPNASFYLWGSDTNHNYTIDDNEAAAANTGMNFDITQRGIMPYITVYGFPATNGQVLYKSTTSATTGTGTTTETITPLTDTTVTTLVTNTNITRTVTTFATGSTKSTNTTGGVTINNITYSAYPNDPNVGGFSAISSQMPIDVNDTTTASLLQQLLQMAAPNSATTAYAATTRRTTAARGGTANPFKNIWDWIVTTGLTSQDLSSENTPSGEPLFCVLTCLYNGTAGTGVTSTIDSTTGLDTTTSMPPVPVQYAKLNINTASLEAMLCLPGDLNYYPYTSTTTLATTAAPAANTNGVAPQWVPAFTQDDVQNIIAYREQNIANQQQDPLQVPNISWLLDAIDPSEYPQLVAAGGMLTGSSTIFSADIVTVTEDGRAFKRVRIVVDDSSGTPVIVYRQDMTDAGWPLPPEIREALRNPNGSLGAQDATSGNRLTFGN